MEIKPPEGITEVEFDQMVLKAADNYPINDRIYDANQGPNCNTYVDDVVESTGAIMPDIKGAWKQNWGEKEEGGKASGGW